MDIILDTGVLVQPQLGSLVEPIVYSENYIERVVYKAGYGNPIIRVENGKDVLLTCYSTEDTTTTNNIQLRKLLLTDGSLNKFILSFIQSISTKYRLWCVKPNFNTTRHGHLRA